MVLKELFLTVSTLGGCGGLERTEILQCLLWESVVVLRTVSYSSYIRGC